MAAIFSTNNYTVKMEKLKDAVFKCADSDPNNPLSPSQFTFIQKQLSIAFPVFHTPTHPTYSAMIHEAIKELGEEDGSNEELISAYIKDNYEGLPWAHNMYLSHHLRKLCESGEIVCDSSRKCYTVPACARTPEVNSRRKGRIRRLVSQRKKGMIADEEGNLGGENVMEESGDLIGFQEDEIEEVGRNEDEEGSLSGGKGVQVRWFHEEDIGELRRSRTEARRRSLIFVEESEELGRTTVDEGEQNAGRPNEELAQEDGDGDEVGRTAVDEKDQNLVVERHNEVLATGDTDKMMLVPAECVEEPPLTIISPPVTNIRCGNGPELAVKESGLKESELKLVLYKGNTSTCEVSAEITPISTKHRMIVCGLSRSPELNQPVRKFSPRKRLKACSQRKSKVSLESMPSSTNLAVVPLLLELDPKKTAYKNPPKKRLNSGRGRKKDCLKTMSSLATAAVDCNLLEHDRLQELLPQRAIETKVSGVENAMWAVWLEPMLRGQYFIPCSVHVGSSNYKCNRFCLDCMGDAFCLNCLSQHKDHRVVQIRKYSWHEAVKVDDMQQHLDVSNIQTYIHSSGKIVCFNCCPQPKADKIVTRCENCYRGLVGPFRFCSIRCMIFATRHQATKFLPINQSQQACTSMLEGPSIEQSETQNNLKLSLLSNLEDAMSMEDEEDFLLQKMLEKCGKRKKQVDQKLTANAQLETEGSYLSGSITLVDQLNSECSKLQIEDQDRQDQIDVGLDVGALVTTYVEGDVPTLHQKCEQEPKQSEETMDSVNSQSKRLKSSGRERQSKDMKVINNDAEGLNEPATGLHSQKQTKQLEKDGQGIMRNVIEASKEDVPSSSKLSAHQQGLCEPATNQNYQMKPENKGTHQRTHYATISSDSHLEQQTGSSELETVKQVRTHRKERRGRPRKYKKGTKNGQESEEINKKPKKFGRGRPRKQEDNKEDLAVLSEQAHKLEDTERKMDVCYDKPRSEAHETIERGQTMPSSDDDIHQRKKQNLDDGDQLDKQQELICPELELIKGNFEVESQVRCPKEKSGKNSAIQVPLSSKDQLRSRLKHQTQCRT